MPYNTNPKVQLVDASGTHMDDDDGRLKVSTEQDAPFGTFVSFGDVAVSTSASDLETLTSEINDAKEILIQADDANTGFVMVGSSASTDATSAVGSRHGIKLVGGQLLILAIARFDAVFLEGSTGTQYVNVAYFK